MKLNKIVDLVVDVDVNSCIVAVSDFWTLFFDGSKTLEGWVIPRTWVTLFGKRISAKTEKCTSVEVLLSPRPRAC